ncbi:MAG: MFS transporter [Actinomycetota bacterium]|nr:MFS transporter [Actinomycetota bacterium]
MRAPSILRPTTWRRLAIAGRAEGARRLGGVERARVIAVLATVGGLASADAATVGASAGPLRDSLGIDNADIGLLVALSSLVAAVAAVPFGVLADRLRRTVVLGGSIALWGIAMLWSATASDFAELLLARLGLGIVMAAAGPTVASLVGDYFPGGDRGSIFTLLAIGELAGAGLGFSITGDIAVLSWRAAFVILALPAFAVAWLVLHLREPPRGQVMFPDLDGARPAERRVEVSTPAQRGAVGEPARVTDAQQLAVARGITPDARLVGIDPARLGLIGAARFVFQVRSNVLLIASGALGYYFLAGVQTFGVEFVGGQYNVSRVLANFLMLFVGAGAAIGAVVGGPLGDRLLRRGRLNGRVLVPAVAAAATPLLFVPALVTHDALTAMPYVVLAAAALAAQNPPIDAARLDIVPAQLWGRAEGIRTLVRALAQALAPLLFGALSEAFGGGRGGLRPTFFVMLLPLAASAVVLWQAARSYPRDVASAAVIASASAAREPRHRDPPGKGLGDGAKASR